MGRRMVTEARHYGEISKRNLFPSKANLFPSKTDLFASPPGFIFTSNRSVDEWLGLFDDPILGNSALDRLAHSAHQIILEGPSYRAKLAPKNREVNDSP